MPASLSEYIGRNDLVSLFHLQMKEAAKELNVSESSLRNICSRWPYRKFQQVDSHLEHLRSDIEHFRKQMERQQGAHRKGTTEEPAVRSKARPAEEESVVIHLSYIKSPSELEEITKLQEMIDSLLGARKVMEEDPNITLELAIIEANTRSARSVDSNSQKSTTPETMTVADATPAPNSSGRDEKILKSSPNTNVSMMDSRERSTSSISLTGLCPPPPNSTWTPTSDRSNSKTRQKQRSGPLPEFQFYNGAGVFVDVPPAPSLHQPSMHGESGIAEERSQLASSSSVGTTTTPVSHDRTQQRHSSSRTYRFHPYSSSSSSSQKRPVSPERTLIKEKAEGIERRRTNDPSTADIRSNMLANSHNFLSEPAMGKSSSNLLELHHSSVGPLCALPPPPHRFVNRQISRQISSSPVPTPPWHQHQQLEPQPQPHLMAPQYHIKIQQQPTAPQQFSSPGAQQVSYVAQQPFLQRCHCITTRFNMGSP